MPRPPPSSRPLALAHALALALAGHKAHEPPQRFRLVAGLEGIDASKMEIVDSLGAIRYEYDEQDRVARPVVKHLDFAPVAVNRDNARVVERVRFGMPAGPEGRIITNARSEKIASAPSWRSLFGKAEHHCVTAISYVVERDAAKEHTYRIQRRDGKLMVVPGLCAVRHFSFTSTGNEYDEMCHVQITSDANEFVATIHDRFICELMTRDAVDAWMSPAGRERSDLLDLLASAPNERYEAVPISPDIWKKKDDPDVARPRGAPVVWQGRAPPGQRTLF